MRHILALSLILLYTGNIYGQEINKKTLSLNDAIELGLKNNPSIQATGENIKSMGARYWSGMALPQPEISYENQWIPSVSKSGVFSEKTIAISQSLEFPSIYFLKSDKLGKEETIANHQFHLAQRKLVSHIKTDYYQVLAKQNQLKSAKENLIISEDFYKKSEIRQNVGEGTNLERLTAKVQFSEAKRNLDIAKNALFSAFAEFNYTLGYGWQENKSVFDLSDSMAFVDYKLNPIELNQLYEKENPQIKIASLNSEIASVEKSLAQSSYLPQLNFAYYLQNRDNNDDFYGFSAGISVPLWFMFEQKGKIREADANQTIAEFDLQSVKNEIALNLKNAFTDYENSLMQVKLYIDDILPQAEEIFRTANSSYDAGELTYLEYLQAKQTLVSSRNNYNNALFDYFQSLFKIEEIVGQNIVNK